MLQVANILENTEPEKFHMGAWFGVLTPAIESEYYEDLSEYLSEDDLIPDNIAFVNLNDNVVFNKVEDTLSLSCNTTACIAGWAIANEYFNGNREPFNRLSTSRYSAESIGAELFELTSQQSSKLFFCDTNSVWYKHADEYKFEFDPDLTETWKIHPKHAADVLRRIVSGEIDLNEEDEEEYY